MDVTESGDVPERDDAGEDDVGTGGVGAADVGTEEDDGAEPLE